jgi:hypothetical protein
MALKFVTGHARVDWVISMIDNLSWYEIEKLQKHLPPKLEDDAYRRGYKDGKEFAEQLHARILNGADN